MITIVLAACPESLRGHLTRWLTEVAPGTFVGKVNSRIRDKLWELVVEECKSGRAIMTFTSRQLEQGYDFRVHNHNWEVIDWFSPHARGCSSFRGNPNQPRRVFPACAGMFPNT